MVPHVGDNNIGMVEIIAKLPIGQKEIAYLLMLVALGSLIIITPISTTYQILEQFC